MSLYTLYYLCIIHVNSQDKLVHPLILIRRLVSCQYTLYNPLITQGPVVQSVVSLISSLRVISLTVLAHLIYNILIFLLKKM